MPTISYAAITREIEQNADIGILPAAEQNMWEETLRKHIALLQDPEDLALAQVYLFLFLLKTKRFKQTQAMRDHYVTIKKLFLLEEQEYRHKLREQKSAHDKKLYCNQLLYYYKLVGYYLTYLEKNLLLTGWNELSSQVNQDKMGFLQRHQLLQGNWLQFLTYARLRFAAFIRRYVFAYTLLSAISIVLLWHGLWGMYDWVIDHFSWSEYIWPYLFTTLLGLFMLYLLGVFFNQIIGDKEELEQIQEMEIEKIEELRGLEKAVKRRLKSKQENKVKENSDTEKPVSGA